MKVVKAQRTFTVMQASSNFCTTVGRYRFFEILRYFVLFAYCRYYLRHGKSNFTNSYTRRKLILFIYIRENYVKNCKIVFITGLRVYVL